MNPLFHEAHRALNALTGGQAYASLPIDRLLRICENQERRIEALEQHIADRDTGDDGQAGERR